MKKAKTTIINTVPKDFKPRKRFVRSANMWLKITAKDGKIIHEWSTEEPVLDMLPSSNG